MPLRSCHNAPGGHSLALIDKPANALDQRGEKTIPVIAALDLKEHREVPAVRERLTRVEALVDARRKKRDDSGTAAS